MANLRDARHHITCIQESSSDESRGFSKISKTLTIIELYGVPGHWLLRLKRLILNKDDENKGAISTDHDESVLYNLILRNLSHSHEKCIFPWLIIPEGE